ncbi:MAG: DUF4837 family protein [Candidatus Cloacimonetes bacterium]|nr:DUF4837 family protein [Candidatus Cloacimonadota bacterium]
MRKLIIILIMAIMLFSCSNQNKGDKGNVNHNIRDRKKPLAWGQRQMIYAFADDFVWKQAENEIRNTLERTVYTTVNEKMFEVKMVLHNKIDDYFRFNNLLFYCDWESDNAVSSYVRSILGDQVLEKLKTDGAGIYPVYNLWADDQLVLFIVGENEEKLLKVSMLQADSIYETFRQRLNKRIEYLAYQEGTKPKSNFTNKIWELDLPMRYVLFKEDEAAHFTSYLARSSSKPDRFLAVYYEVAEASDLSSDWLIHKRQELAAHYYDGDSFTQQDITIMKKKIAGYDGWMIRGRWQNAKQAVGGAFSAFAFYEPAKRLFFLIDNSVYYPEGNKLPALLELEIISNSLKIK